MSFLRINIVSQSAWAADLWSYIKIQTVDMAQHIRGIYFCHLVTKRVISNS